MTTKEKGSKKKKKACPSCGSSMVHETRTDTVEYHDHRKEFEATGWWCTKCDEAIFEGPALEKAERAFVELRAAVDEVMLPEQIAEIRAKLKLSQREAGKVLGGGPRAFQKYEAGAVPVSTPMNNLLKLLGNDPKRIRELSVSVIRSRTSSRASRGVRALGKLATAPKRAKGPAKRRA
jgi:HTH-type transcriptional regulator / antitoxin MqsA